MHRFFVLGDLKEKVNIAQEDVHHIFKVLRMQKGDELVVVNEHGQSAKAIIEVINKQEVVVEIKDLLIADSKPQVRIILGQGISKGEKMDWVVQKAVELGATDIVPLALERSVVRYDEKKSQIKQERWQKIALEAAKQCQSTFITKVHCISSLADALVNFSVDTGFVAFEEEKENNLRCYLKNIAKDIQSIFVIIGTEGGFTLVEVEKIKAQGFESVSLGKRILRTETAAVATLSVVMYELAGLGGQDA